MNDPEWTNALCWLAFAVIVAGPILAAVAIRRTRRNQWPKDPWVDPRDVTRRFQGIHRR